MTSLKRILTGIILSVSLIPKAHADGYIVPNGVVTNFLQGEISVMWNPTDMFYTGFLFQPQANMNSFVFSPVVDVGVRVFFVSPNDPISLQPILSHNYTELMSLSQYTFNMGVSFYVGLYTGNDPSNPQPGGIYNDPLFGWARLVNNNGRIQLLGGALEYQGGGIIAGTQTILAVPEPSSIALVVLGAGVIGFFRWRKTRPNWNVAIRPGDSSDPEAFLIGNQLVFLTQHYTGNYGPDYSSQLSVVNQALHYLSTNNNAGTDYQLTPLSLTNWPAVH